MIKSHSRTPKEPKNPHKPTSLQISVPLSTYPTRTESLDNRFRDLVLRACKHRKKLVAKRNGLSMSVKHISGTDAVLDDSLESLEITKINGQLKQLSEGLERLLGLGRVKMMMSELQFEDLAASDTGIRRGIPSASARK